MKNEYTISDYLDDLCDFGEIDPIDCRKEKIMAQIDEKELAQKYHAIIKRDDRRGNGWYQFVLNGWTIWATYSNDKIWTMAQCPNNNFINHQHFDDLEQAFQFAQSN